MGLPLPRKFVIDAVWEGLYCRGYVARPRVVAIVARTVVMTSAYVLWLAAGGDDPDNGGAPRRAGAPRAPNAGASRVRADAERAAVPDSALIVRLRASDEEAFAEVYHAHARAIAAYVVSVGGSVADAQDVVQESYLALWRRRATLQPTDRIVGFLYKTARNIALTRIRHVVVAARFAAEQGDAPVAGNLSEMSPEVRIDEEECHRRLADALAALPERQRLAIQLRFFEEMSYADVADVVGVSEKAAFMLVSRAVAALRPLAALFVNRPEPR